MVTFPAQSITAFLPLPKLHSLVTEAHGYEQCPLIPYATTDQKSNWQPGRKLDVPSVVPLCHMTVCKPSVFLDVVKVDVTASV